VQTAINELALNELRTVAPIVVTGSGNNTDTNTLSLDMDAVIAEPSLDLTDKLLIQRGSSVRSVTFAQLGQGGGDNYLRGTVTLVNTGNSGTVVGDPLNASISEGVEPTINVGDPVVGVHYIVGNSTVVSSISGVLTTYLKGDYVEWTSSGWIRIIRTLDNYVESFNGRSRVVTPLAGDYDASMVSNAADVSSATTFQDDLQVDGILTVIGNAIFNSSEGIKLPVGTTALRPAIPNKGDFRFNSDNDTLEYYNGTIWINIDVTALASAIQQNTDDLVITDGNVATNTADIATNALSIVGLVSDSGTNTTDIATNVADIVSLNLSVGAVDTKADSNTALIGGLDIRVTATEADLVSQDARITLNASDITAVEASVLLNATDIGTNATSIITVDTRVDGVDADLQATKVRVTDNEFQRVNY
jgi:hypothetical protein